MTADTITPANYPDQLEEVAASLYAHWIDRGMEALEARGLAFEVVEHLRLHYGGTKVYISKGQSYEVAKRDAEILQEWNGQNTLEVCRRHDISEGRLRQIWDAARERRSANGG